jgi:hypothetical protein
VVSLKDVVMELVTLAATSMFLPSLMSKMIGVAIRC